MYELWCYSGTVDSAPIRTSQSQTMQQVVEEGGEGYGDGASYIYDDMFPALPESANPVAPATIGWAAVNNKMRVGSSDITQVLYKPLTKRLLPTTY